MNKFALLGISMASNLFSGIIKKGINNKYENSFFSYQFFNCVVSLFSAVFLVVMSENLSASFFTVALAIVFGAVTLIQQISNLMALENGPFSYTSVIISLSTLIPALSGAIFWNEKISFLQCIGILFLVLSLILSVDFSKRGAKGSIKWLICCFIAFFCTGLIGVMQKIHQTSSHKDELDAFLVIAFFVSFFVSLIFSVFFRNRREFDVYVTSKSIINVIPIIFMALSGLFVALNNKLNLHLSGVMDSAVFFPLVNGGGLVLTTAAAIAVFKEKLTITQIIGLISGIVSVVLLCLS